MYSWILTVETKENADDQLALVLAKVLSAVNPSHVCSHNPGCYRKYI